MILFCIIVITCCFYYIFKLKGYHQAIPCQFQVSLGVDKPEACLHVTCKVVHVDACNSLACWCCSKLRTVFRLQASVNAAGGHKQQESMRCIGMADLAVAVIPEFKHNRC